MKRVLLLLCEGFEMYEAASFYDVLGWSGAYGSERVEVVTVGLQAEVRGTFGVKIVPDAQLSDAQAEDFDALAIPGGFETYGFYEQAYSEPVANLIRRFDESMKPIASICVGALPVAYSGVLKGRPATTYHLKGGLRRRQLAEFGATVADRSIVCDKNIISSTCPSTAIGVAFVLLAMLTGDENADAVRYLMGFNEVKRSRS